MKFKVGDIIRGKVNHYPATNERMAKAEVLAVCSRKKANDRICIKVIEHEESPFFIGRNYEVDNTDEYFELCEKKNECIVIYRKDNEVIALDKTTKEKAVAKCSPEDTFDFNTGAKIAFGRLIGEDIAEKKDNFYNGKIVCVDVKGDMKKYYTVGKVYEVKDGRFEDNERCITPPMNREPVTDIEDFTKKVDLVKFVELIMKEK